MTSSLVIGLTGGIGVGKSTVAALFGSFGATVVDVDQVGRDVLEPGGGAYVGVVERFGPAVLAPDGTIDRALLAEEVFAGANRLDELEAISHPAINAALDDLVAGHDDGVLVLDMAVLVESHLGWAGDDPLYHRVVVVEAPLALRLARLLERGMTAEDARSRMAVQASATERRAMADLVIVNDRDLAHLEAVVTSLWPTVEAWSLQEAVSVYDNPH